MALLCLSGCGGDNKPVAEYGGCNLVTAQYGYSRFALVSCDYQFTNILDAAEWEAAVGTGDVHISPEGILIINPPSSTSFVATGCGKQIQGVLTYPMTFETYQTSPELEDWVYWPQYFSKADNWRIIPIDCRGMFNVTPEYAAATASPPATVEDESPGYEFSVTTVPTWQQGEGRNGKWAMAFEIITNQPMPGIYLPGVLQVLA